MSAPASSPVRTATEPMAFSSSELLRGGITVWLVFLGLLFSSEVVHLTLMMVTSGNSPGALTILGVLYYLVPIAIIGGTVSAIVMLLGLPLVRLIAHLLRRVRKISLHVIVYTVVGIAIGSAFLALLRGGYASTPASAWDFFIILPAASAGLAVPLGWWWTARRALREDAGLVPPRPKTNPDDAFEDQATDITTHGTVSEA